MTPTKMNYKKVINIEGIKYDYFVRLVFTNKNNNHKVSLSPHPLLLLFLPPPPATKD